MKHIRLMIVDDIPEFGTALSSSFLQFEDIQVVCIANTGAKAIEYALQYHPDVILMDIQMEDDNAGISASKQILSVQPEIKIIALTIHEDSECICKAFDVGVVDYALKTSSPNDLIKIIRECVNSSNPEKIKQILAKDLSHLKQNQRKISGCFHILLKLSKSEIDVLKSLCNGMSYAEIARQRYIEEVSIRSMVAKITKKTGVKYIRELINQFNDCHFFESEYSEMTLGG